MIIRNLTGKRFGRLLVLGDYGKRKRGYILWQCLCDCGKTKTTFGFCLINGSTKSCGCLLKEGNNKTHGLSHTRIHTIWKGLKARCENVNQEAYPWYGGRGIKICEAWQKFENFYEDMKDGYSDNLTIDRIDNNGNYELSNCRWATMKEQNNNRRDNKMITYKNKTKSMKQWAEELKINYSTLTKHIRNNWTYEEALKYGAPQMGV